MDLKGIEKAAALLVSLGEDKASKVLKVMDEKTIEKLAFQLYNTTDVSYDNKVELMKEFHQLMLEKKFSIRGGADYARGVLAQAVSADASDKILDRVNTATQENPFEFMDKADPEQLLELLGNEHPQTISLILAHLGDSSPDKASQVLQGLEPNIQLDVTERIANMENIAPEVLELLYTSLKSTISSLLDVSASKIGGTKLMAEILNRVDATAEQQLMDRLEQKDAELAKEIKELMFVFDDLKYVDKRGIQKIVGAIGNDLEKISYALKAASEDVKQSFLEIVSEGARAEIESNMRDIPISLRDALEAQQEILTTATELIRDKEIIVDRTGEAESMML